MFGTKKIKKSEVDEQLLDEIFKLKREWNNIKTILDRSVDPSEIGLYDLAVAEAKYIFLLREARKRKISAMR